ncbi:MULTISPECIES: GNAT family N-acetyltransferase [Cyanophyceae]|uniref:GNAT family N-acetyltransferase n=1 Tax=Stenomitos frigidus AS-A4 TaxID=2933935 RepID=A0ABV0KCK4_9CYAN|nr:GNAT family N-acetyltransferase [Phormidium sp. FACHB-592]
MSSNPLSLSIRAAQLKDLAALVELLSDSFYPNVGFMRWFLPLLRVGVYEDLRYRLRSSSASDYVCLVAVILPSTGEATARRDLVGTVEITFRSTSPFQFRSLPYPYVSNLAVYSDVRRRGVAQKLLGACESIALEGGFQDLYLHVLEDNHQARRLYEKAGYRVMQADPFWRGWLFQQPRRLLLHKRLAAPFSQTADAILQ